MNWQEDSEQLLREIAPEDTEGRQIIIKTPSDVGIIAPDGVGGWFGQAMYEVCNVDLNDVLLVIEPNRFNTWQQIVGVVLHEFAHWIDCEKIVTPKQVFYENADPKTLEIMRRLVAAATAKEQEPRLDINGNQLPPWQGHGQRFLRAAGILAYRAEQVYASIRPHHVRFSQPYFGYSEASFMGLLSDETQKTGSIRDLIQATPSKRFGEVYAMLTGEVI